MSVLGRAISLRRRRANAGDGRRESRRLARVSVTLAIVSGGLLSVANIGTPPASASVSVHPVPGTSGIFGVACGAPGRCLAVGQAKSRGVVIPIINGAPGPLQVVPKSFLLAGVACPTPTRCLAVGQDLDLSDGAVVPVTNGVPGTERRVHGPFNLYGVACSTASACLAVGASATSSGPRAWCCRSPRTRCRAELSPSRDLGV